MVSVRWISPVVLLVLSAMGTNLVADDVKIPIEDLPKAVLRAAQKEFPEAQIVGASKETDDEETTYEVEMKLNGKSIDLSIDDDGEIESIEKEIEADDLPKAVTRAVARLFPNSRIAKVEEVSDADDMVVYELTLVTEGKGEKEIVFSPNGKIMDDDDDDDDEKDKNPKN